MNTSLSDLTRYIAMLAAPNGYRATVRLLGGIHGSRVVLEARRRPSAATPEYSQEVSFDALERLGAAAIATRFDRAVRAALAAGKAREPASNRSVKG
ncbi:MAG TPA: hypothetical protein VND24_05480 [Steroidobacteraceae bacterium]|nr:hypothetical protein [Steroidobacteraceae bacterium]